jgi:hypothetical protein
MSDIINRDINNFQQFRSHVAKHGFSLTNFYDVQFLIGNSGSSFLTSVFTRNYSNNLNSPYNLSNLLRLYADECTIPGYSISTGDFRITNSPNMKYAYGVVNNEITMSFISDADSEIRQIFDSWGNYIYSGVSSNTVTRRGPNINAINDLGRTRYKDDYTMDIVVIKLERFSSSKQNSRRDLSDPNKPRAFKQVPISSIFPRTDLSKFDIVESGFGEAIQKYSVRLKNAFPTTISAIPLSSGSSQLVKIQVTFEYDMAVPASQTGGSVKASSEWRTVVD